MTSKLKPITGTPITAEEDVKHVEPPTLNHQARSTKHIASEHSSLNIHKSPAQRSNLPTSQHRQHHLPAKRRNRLRAWEKLTNGYDLPESLLNTHYETRIADHVLLGKTLKLQALYTKSLTQNL